MSTTCRSFWPSLVLLFLALIPSSTVAQDATGQAPFGSADEINARHDRQLADVERRRLADLDVLASKKNGAQGDSTYRELFLRAMAHDMTAEATPAAERYLTGPGAAADVRALATLLAAVNDSEHGRSEKAIGRFRALLADRQRTGYVDPMPLLAVGETFLRRLIRAGRYDDARQLCSLFAEASGEPEVSAHFASSLKSLKLVGRVAPNIDATDVDGRRVRLSDLKGKVVLVSFWASWCPPCLDAFSGLNALDKKYRGQGLEIIGVNLDAHHEDIKDLKAAMPIVRHVLVHHGVTWTNVLNDDGTDADIARAYGVESVPTNVLISADGTVLGVSIGEPELEAAILEALAPGSRKR